ncbi:50S ribosomal protein L11 [Candidatus Pacearchaeota archaeon]|nr:50S ribosomal protein L11 [Candidatus Pacearchaeota archaeon]
MIIKILAEGGAMTPNPSLSQKFGPAGINMSHVLQKVNDATKEFKGIKVPVEISVNPIEKTFEVKVFSPPASELLKKELGIEKGSGIHGKIKMGNASIEQIISVAKTKFPNMLARDLKAAVRNIVGTCVSLGILIENKHPHEIQKEIGLGVYDKEIKSEKIETSKERRKELDDFFKKIKEEQDKLLKAEQAAKEAEKAAAEATTPATPVVATTPAKPTKSAKAK